MRNLPRPSSLLAPLLTAFVLMLGADVASAQRGALAGVLVDTEGNPVAKHQLVLQPLAGGAKVKMKTKGGGKFGHSFLLPGEYRIASADEKAYLSHFDIVVAAQGGSEIARWASDADPEAGLPPFRITVGQKTDMQGAVTETERVLAEQPDLASAHLLRGIALSSLGNAEEAERAMRTAIGFDAELPSSAGALGTLLLHRAKDFEDSDPEKSQAMLSEAAQLLARQVEESDPPPVAILTNWALALDRSGQDQQAIGVLERLIEAEPGTRPAYYHLADLHRETGDEEKALAILESLPSAGEEDSSADVIYNMAVQAFNAGEYEKALGVLDRTLSVDPGFVLAHHLRGRIFLAQEDYEGATRELGRFVELAPDHPRAAEDRMILESLASIGDGS